MTVSTAIEMADGFCPNTFTREYKLRWLSELESTVQQEIRDTHENSGSFSGYTDADGDTELLAPSPYYMMYVYYLMSKYDSANKEIGSYGVNASMFNSIYEAYANAYNRTHRPKQNNSIRRL